LWMAGPRWSYIEPMATLAQPIPQQDTIREALGTLTLPGGIALRSLEFRENSHGEPALFVTYSFASNGRTDEEQAKALLKLVDQTLRALDTLNLPFFQYVNFLPK
jgi:hypothetical protein